MASLHGIFLPGRFVPLTNTYFASWAAQFASLVGHLKDMPPCLCHEADVVASVYFQPGTMRDLKSRLPHGNTANAAYSKYRGSVSASALDASKTGIYTTLFTWTSGAFASLDRCTSFRCRYARWRCHHVLAGLPNSQLVPELGSGNLENPASVASQCIRQDARVSASSCRDHGCTCCSAAKLSSPDTGTEAIIAFLPKAGALEPAIGHSVKQISFDCWREMHLPSTGRSGTMRLHQDRHEGDPSVAGGP